MSTAAWIYTGVFILALILWICYIKIQKFWKCTLFTLFTGLGTLGLVRLAGTLLVIPLAVTPLSILTAAVLGIPGVVLMLVLQLI